MKSTILAVVAAAALVSAQYGAEPSCAVPCISKAISSAGCQPNDEACMCGSGFSSIQAIGGPCIIAACTGSDLIVAASVGLALCSAYHSMTSASAMTTPVSSLPTSAVKTTVTTTSTSASSTVVVTKSSGSASNGSSSSPATTSAPTSNSSKASVASSASSAASGAANSGSSSAPAAVSSKAAAPVVMAGMGGLVGAIVAVVAAL